MDTLLEPKFSYEIKPRTAELGGGWKLTLLEEGVEIGGGVFPPVENIENEKEVVQTAYDDALDVAFDWLASR